MEKKNHLDVEEAKKIVCPKCENEQILQQIQKATKDWCGHEIEITPEDDKFSIKKRLTEIKYSLDDDNLTKRNEIADLVNKLNLPYNNY